MQNNKTNKYKQRKCTFFSKWSTGLTMWVVKVKIVKYN